MTCKRKDGIYPAIDRDEYDLIDRVNVSTLQALRRSSVHYRYLVTTKGEDTDPMRVGRVVHVACFEPERFRTLVAVWDGKVRRGKDWDKFVADNPGRELLTENQYEKVQAIAAAVRADKIAMDYVSRGQGEVTMLWTVTVNGVVIQCKGRIDFDGAKGVVDLKTTFDASQDGFSKQFISMKYDAKSAWYSDARELLTGESKPFSVVAVESSAPHVVQTYEIGEDFMERGRAIYRRWLERLAECRKTSHWPPYSEKVELLQMPEWAQPGGGGGLDLDWGDDGKTESTTRYGGIPLEEP